MCGIAGVVGIHESPLQLEQLAGRMASKLHHRGPDGAAFYFDSQALLVHTRLSIIDLSGGTQPIHNEDKSIWIVFNGEIFNFVELREMLECRGHRFYTNSDTEVIVHLYEEYGVEFVSHLNGQFAIALWDIRASRLLLVRDRMGIAPLYYKLTGKRLTFASEIKSLLEDTSKPPSLDLSAFNQIFTCWTTLPAQTPFHDIQSLPPGSMAIFENGELHVRTYWDISFPDKSASFICDEKLACAEIEALLLDSTKIRLRSDVPVGAYLSGGLDSSILTSLMHLSESAQLSTFSISFADEGHDESPYQKEMVGFLKAQHKTTHCKDSDIGDDFLDAMWHIEYPVIRSAPIPMGFLSGLARRNQYKVVLTGEGADEIFGGYDIFKETKIRRFWSVNPDSTMRAALLARLYPYLNLNQGSANSYVKSFFGAGLDNRDAPLFSHLTRINSTSRIKSFYTDDFDQTFKDSALSALVEMLPPQFEKWHWMNKVQYLEIKTLMASYLLTSQGDRMLMRNSVEGRFPFLDHRLVEFASTLHPSLKMKRLNEKYVLRRAMQKYLPERIANRIKQPYRAPNAPAFFGEKAPEYFEELTSAAAVQRLGLFDGKKLGLLFKKARSGKPISYADNMSVVATLSSLAVFKHFVGDYSKNFGPENAIMKNPLQRIQ